ncbi:MAG TPA: AIR synthase family protein [Anaerolineaceae bacterium]|nr:AIR synthase family protein [Anaerolineaceae bacterium]
MNQTILPVGKLPAELFKRVLAQLPVKDPRVLLGPGMGLDCAVIDAGERLFVLKSDPITFASDEIGWYLVQVNSNDIATTGAVPRWMMLTVLLPEGKTTAELVDRLTAQVARATQAMGITVIGGHTEITHGLEQPILSATLIGEVERDHLVTPRGASPGDRLLLTKGVPIEATALLAREVPDRLKNGLSSEELERAAGFLFDPGISVLRDAQVALSAGKVTAMHDPTEGGLASALWELAEACGNRLVIDPQAVPVPELSRRVCAALGIDPLAAIASGALLLTAPPSDASKIRQSLENEKIPCAEIGWVETGPAEVIQELPDGQNPLPRPARDEVARIFDTGNT